MTTLSALVLFSGGQDSAITLSWALDQYSYVETVGFAYGQRHHIEMQSRKKIREELSRQFPQWAEKLGPDHILEMETLGAISQTAMTEDIEIQQKNDALPNTFVPGRNLAFLVFGAALAWRRKINLLVGGMCQADFSGYPDCREDTLQAQMQAINLGMDVELKLETPLMHLSKAQSWSLCEQTGGTELVDLVNEHSHTCYKGVREVRHEWGYGCGECPACELRQRGWENYRSGA